MPYGTPGRSLPIPVSRPPFPTPTERVVSGAAMASGDDVAIAGSGLRRSVIVGVNRATGRLGQAFAERTCAAWGLTAILDDVLIALGELTQNAVRHATCAPVDARGRHQERVIGLGLTFWPGARKLVVTVRDGDPRPPVRRPLADLSTLDLADAGQLDMLEESGRGVWTVEKLADRFGWYPVPPIGKAVWCSFTTPR